MSKSKAVDPDDIAVRRGQTFLARGGKRVAVDAVDWEAGTPRVRIVVLEAVAASSLDPVAALAAALSGAVAPPVPVPSLPPVRAPEIIVALTWAPDAAGVKMWRMPTWYQPE